MLLAKPDIDVSTKYVYENLELDMLERHPDIDGMIQDIEERNLEKLCGKLENVLESVTGKEYPVIGEIEQVMKEAGALAGIMSGSGPTVFGIFKETESAKTAMGRIKGQNLAKEVFLSKFR